MPITFKENNIQRILRGQKIQTRRRGKNKLKVGRVYGIKANWFKKPAAHVRITRRFKQRLGDISPEDIHKEGYSSLEQFQAIWIKLHGAWTPDKVVTVYEFALVKSNGKKQARINGKNIVGA